MGMKILADTNVFIKFNRRLPLPSEVETVLESSLVERFISAVTVIELFCLWKSNRVPLNPDAWLDDALDGWTVIPINTAIARQSVLWDWSHKDPADRIIAATAAVEKIELWHTDTRLKKISGFPGRYFANQHRAR
jgi:PIN domain nuclease of toxin-antitoxin system